MDLAEDDDVIQALPSKRADEPLYVCVGESSRLHRMRRMRVDVSG
jgi:hypothetical protein